MGSAGPSSCVRTLHCSVNNGAVSKGSKARNDTVQSVGCGGLILSGILYLLPRGRRPEVP